MKVGVSVKQTGKTIDNRRRRQWNNWQNEPRQTQTSVETYDKYTAGYCCCDQSSACWQRWKYRHK